jgi:hypothetical protein
MYLLVRQPNNLLSIAGTDIRKLKSYSRYAYAQRSSMRSQHL